MIEVGINQVKRRAMYKVAVRKEMHRRLDLGFDFQGNTYEFDQGLVIMGMQAGIQIAIGTTPGDLRWFDASEDFTVMTKDDIEITMDAGTCWAFGKAATKHKRSHEMAAKALIESPTLNFRNNVHWP